MATDHADLRLPELCTALDPHVELCTIGGVEHDYRPYTYRRAGRARTSLRCVWCHVVACGDPDDADLCIEPYHHTVDHRTRAGVTWPLGGSAP